MQTAGYGQQYHTPVPPVWIMKIAFAEQHTRHSRRQESIRLPVQEYGFQHTCFQLAAVGTAPSNDKLVRIPATGVGSSHLKQCK